MQRTMMLFCLSLAWPVTSASAAPPAPPPGPAPIQRAQVTAAPLDPKVTRASQLQKLQPAAIDPAVAKARINELRAALTALESQCAEATRVKASWSGRLDHSVGMQNPNGPPVPQIAKAGLRPIFNPPHARDLQLGLKTQGEGLIQRWGWLTTALGAKGEIYPPAYKDALVSLRGSVQAFTGAASVVAAQSALTAAQNSLRALEKQIQ